MYKVKIKLLVIINIFFNIKLCRNKLINIEVKYEKKVNNIRNVKQKQIKLNNFFIKSPP